LLPRAAKFQAVMRGSAKRKSDLAMMAEAGLSVAFHAKPVVRTKADCALSHSGLDGVVELFER
jgi:phosphoserine phosphatase